MDPKNVCTEQARFIVTFAPPALKGGTASELFAVAVFTRQDGTLRIEEWQEIRHPTTGQPYRKVSKIYSNVDRAELATMMCGDSLATLTSLEAAMIALGHESPSDLLNRIGACSEHFHWNDQPYRGEPATTWPVSAELEFEKQRVLPPSAHGWRNLAR